MEPTLTRHLTLGGTGLKSAWKKRWVVLKDNVLAWYKDEVDSKPLGFVYVENVRIYKLDEKEAKKPFCFEIQAENTTKRLQCVSDEELKEWVSNINKAKAKRLAQLSLNK
jgi:hypothetical protein